jgi:hypothetical protein
VAADATQSFVFSTDASGNITSWSINVSGFADPGVDGVSVNFSSSPFADFLAMTECAPFFDPQNGGGCQIDPVVQSAAGAWTVAQMTPPPAPAPDPLIATVAALKVQVTALSASLASMTTSRNDYRAAYSDYYTAEQIYKGQVASLTKELAAANAEIALLKAELKK